MKLRNLLHAFFFLFISTAAAEQAEPIKVGILLDKDGPYSFIAGDGSLIAAEMAIEDSGERVLGRPIKLMYGDHGNDVGRAVDIARQWLDEEHVDIIADFVGSPIALAVQELNREQQAVLIFNAVVSTALTNESCAPTGIHWMYDSHMFSRAIGRMARAKDRQRWFVLYVDNAYGQNSLKQITAAVTANGGEVIGQTGHPLGERHMLRYMLEAERAQAQVLAIASAGNDLQSAVKQAYDLRSVSLGEMRVTPVGATVANIRGAGLGVTQGMLLATPFYWDQSEASRNWSQRFFERYGRMPTEPQAGVYSSLMHYFKAVEAAQSTDAATVAEKMRELPVNDAIVEHGHIRADGRLVQDIRLVRMKSPQQSQHEWDTAEVIETIPGEAAFLPLAQSRCHLVRN